MRIDHPAQGPGSGGHADLGAAAVAAQAAHEAARLDADPAHRAAAGWALAGKSESATFQAVVQPSADAGANAQTALSRADLPAPLRQQVNTVVEHLGQALLDGRIDPHVNDAFREHLYSLATEPPDSAAFRGALAQMNRAAEVLDRVELAQGTRLAYDANASQPEVTRSGLPILDIENIDADLYFKTRDGTLHIESVKASPLTLENAVENSLQRMAQDPPTQLDRQAQWQEGSTTQQPRRLGLYLLDDGPGFYHLLKAERLDRLNTLVAGDTADRRFVVGQRRYSLDEFRLVAQRATAAAPEHVEAQLRQHLLQGKPEESFRLGAAYRTAYSELAGSADVAFQRYGAGLGEALPALKPLPGLAPPSLAQGGVLGGLAGGVMTLVHVGLDGEISTSDLGQLALHSAEGAGLGALAAAGERVVVPWLDRAIGPTVQRLATQAAAPGNTLLATAEGAGHLGAGVRTLASRVGGATVVGAAIGTVLSAYDNRAGLVRGDSQAIGHVAADTAVAAGSVAAATLAGAAAGSVVPVAGTAVGAAVGLIVGVGIAYGAQISGARDGLASLTAGLVDGVKRLF